MGQFVAILRDSFREAVDGFVIYVMAFLAAVMLVILASISFAPDPGATALPTIVQRFGVAFPDRGKSGAAAAASGVSFAAKDIQHLGGSDGPSGKHKFRLEVTSIVPPNSPGAILAALTPKWLSGVIPPPKGQDTFRMLIVGWSKPPGTITEFRAGARSMNVVESIDATPAEMAAVTDDQMTEFLRHQLSTHAAIDNAVVTRVATGVAEPKYAFDVELPGRASPCGWPHTTKLFFGTWTIDQDMNLGIMLWILEDKIVNGIGAGVTFLIATIITAFFIPNMLRKGSIDLLIAKPIGRSRLLIYKYIGGLTFVFLLSAISVFGTWLVLAVRSGFWDPTFLLVVPGLMFSFAILYAFSTLVAVLTRSAIAAMLLTIGLAFFLWLVGFAKGVADEFRARPDKGKDGPAWLYTTADLLNDTMPRYKDVDKIQTRLVARATMTIADQRTLAVADRTAEPSWAGSVGVSLAFIALWLGLACWRLETRDG